MIHMKLMIKKPMAGNTILLLMTFFVFLPVLSSGFLLTWDDAHYLLDNPTVRDFNLQNLLHIFLTPINNLYTPLTVSSFALEHQLFGFNPLVFHLDNLLLHICTTGLIIALARHIGLTSRASLFAGLLFAIHPMHVESVAWVTERKDCLYAFFYLLALGQYVKYVTLGARRDFYFSVGWGLLSLLSKPMAISLPLICWAMDYLLERKTSAASSIKEKLLYLIC